jgi:hypothetical protein
MGNFIRSNTDKTKEVDNASAFARLALSKVGGSSVYIAPKNNRLVDSDQVL